METVVTFTPSPRVAGLVSEMTLDEKLGFVRYTPHPDVPANTGRIAGVPRLGVPDVLVTDGPAGIRAPQRATALPAPVALASGFDEDLAHEYGAVVGTQGRALGHDVVLGPMVNIIRVPNGGRNAELLSEDPLVSSRIGSSLVEGIQNAGLIASVKHLVCNNQELNRMKVDVRIGDQALREIELPAFEAAVRAGAGSVVAASNSVNGAFSGGNPWLLQELLKGEWGFEGWVVSDWDATHAADYLAQGLDQEMPDTDHFGATLRAAIVSGEIPESALDEAVCRMLGQFERFGLLDAEAPQRPALDLEAGARVARKVAREGAVLLHNPRALLPFDAAAPSSYAVIGATALDPRYAPEGSVKVPARPTSPLEAIRRTIGPASRVVYAPGYQPVGVPPEGALTPPFRRGELPSGKGSPQPVYEGTLRVDEPGIHHLTLTAIGGWAAMEVDGRPPHFSGKSFGDSTTLSLDLGVGEHELVLSALPHPRTPVQLEFTWTTPSHARRMIADAAEAARSTDAAIVFVHDYIAECYDRPELSLPGPQDELIEAVTEANPNTVVVLNTGSSVLLPWLDRTAAVLAMWYPGEQGAEACADVLFGEAEPGGRLTQTFVRSADETAVAGDEQRYPGVEDVQHYSEGIFVGYRWHDHHEVAPLFPFGHGLSYTTFVLENAAVRALGDTVSVEVDVRNTGDRAGSEVVQVYVGPSSDVSFPQAERALVGYVKARLEPGARTRVRIEADRRALSGFDPATGAWTLGTGERRVMVGTSAGDLPLTAVVRVEEPER